MAEEEEEERDGGIFLLIMGVLALIILGVVVVAGSAGDLPAATVTGPAAAEEEPVPDTTEAPAPTTTEAPEATTTTTTAAPQPVTMWDALNGSGEAGQFAAIGGALGLREDLETLVDEDGNPVMRTLFAPSDAALAAFGPEAIAALTSDQDAANALVGYHFLDEPLSAADLVARDGETVTTRTGLPLSVDVVDGDVILNDVATVTVADLEADNGIVHIVDVVLEPPTLNEVLALDNIEFETSSATITAEGQTTLQQAVAFFTENATVNAQIEGHTDTAGDAENNLDLSQRRAESVLAFLVESGLDAERFTAVGFGEARPILVDGVEDMPASRRIEFNVR